MKKQLNTDAIKNELEGSVFFPGSTREPVHPPQTTDEIPQASKIASNRDSSHASTLALEADFTLLHKTLKFIGKEVLYVRLTQEEKNQVADIEYTYQRQGIKTSGNEIGRIALNVLLADYKANGENSLLAKILTELHT